MQMLELMVLIGYMRMYKYFISLFFIIQKLVIKFKILSISGNWLKQVKNQINLDENYRDVCDWKKREQN